VSIRSTSDHRTVAGLLAVFVLLSLLIAPSCARKGKDGNLKLTESIYGFYLGETKAELFSRARGVITITRAPAPPLGFRGELWNCSAALVYRPGIDHVRLAFYHDHLWEIIVYFQNTSAAHLEWLKNELENTYQAHATAPDGTREMTAKTYRLSAPGISITLQRITKKDSTELFVQYFHEEIRREIAEKNRAAKTD
jgi:hypothetical protein